MQSSFRAGRSPDRQIVVSFGPRQRTDVEGARFRVEAGPNQRRQTRTVFRITYCTLFAEWSTAIVAVGLLSFYVFAILDTKSGHRDNINYKLLVAYVIMSAYMRLCYVLTTISKTRLLIQQGPCESSTLPGQIHINAISSFMFMVEPAHFICLCWITHVAFPMNTCDENVSRYTCIALHIASTIFVSMWILTGLAVIILIVTVTFFDGRRQGTGSNWWQENIGNQTVESSLRLTSLPDPIREQIIGNLPTTTVPPADGEPCAICFDLDAGDEWRILPCGHRFHPGCVDDWIKKQRGACPTCRHDPTLPLNTDGETGAYDSHIQIADISASVPQADLSSAQAQEAAIAVSLAPSAASARLPATSSSIPASSSTPASALESLGQVLQHLVAQGAANGEHLVAQGAANADSTPASSPSVPASSVFTPNGAAGGSAQTQEQTLPQNASVVSVPAAAPASL